MKKSVFLLLLGAVLANAQQITSINFKGLVHLSPETAKEIMGLKVGDELNVDSTDRAIAKLFRQGYFDDIYIENKGGDVTVTVKEKPSIARIDIKGVVTNDKTAIDGLINIKQGNMYDELAIERAKERIRQYYESKGYFDTVVDVTKEPVAGNESSLFVTMNINRGENIIIENVNLVGAKLFDYDDVEPVIANKEREFMGWMWGRNDGKVKLFELPNDPARIQDKYYQKGYLDATVSNPYLNAYMDNYTADLTYYVTEGEQYRVSSVDIEAPEFLELDKEGIYFDAGTGRGEGVEVRLTDYDGNSLLHEILDASKINGYGNYKLSEGRTNNFGELTGIFAALKYAKKNNIKVICGDSNLVIEFWSRGKYNSDGLEKDTIDLIKRVTSLRAEFEKNGGKVKKISGDVNPADLGFHK